MNKKQTISIVRAMAGLKDFQRETVEYVFKQMFENNRNNMLVADEVGLGKTIVAKGLIAKAFEKHMETGPNKENGYALDSC